MAPVLTLHHGQRQAVYADHPTVAARKALEAAAAVEGGEWAAVMLRFAHTLPDRPPITRGGED